MKVGNQCGERHGIYVEVEIRGSVRGAVVSTCRLSTRLGLFEMLPS